jgi:hypothetical protein
MLSLCLHDLHKDPLMRRKLQELTPQLSDAFELIIFDTSGDTEVLAELRQFAKGRNMQIIVLDPSSNPVHDMNVIAKAAAEFPYVLVLNPNEWVATEYLSELVAHLLQTQPEVCVLGHAYWYGDPAVIWPTSDMPRLTALPVSPNTQELRALTPLIHRLIQRDAVSHNSEEPDQNWNVWCDVLDHAQDITAFTHPVIRTPLPKACAAKTLAAATAVATARPEDLGQVLQWSSDAFHLAGAEDALDLLSAITTLVRTFPEGISAFADQDTSPFGSVLKAVKEGETTLALSQIILVATTNSQIANQLMVHEVARLRRDLDLALPGPDYLRTLYDRIRAQ